MRPLSRRERKVAALGLLAGLIGAGWYLGVERLWLAPLRALDEQTLALQEQQRRYASLMLQQTALQAQFKRAQDDPGGRESLLSGDDPNTVTANLMQRVADQVERLSHHGVGCEVTQSMPMPASEQGAAPAAPYRQVKVSLTLACAIEPLALLMHALEYNQPSLFIDQLSIRRSASAPAQGGAGRLEVHLLIHGYMHRAGSAGASS